MLILSRKFNESIIIDGRIVVKVVRLDHDVVKLGIEAPMDVPVHRQEIYDEIQRNNKEALTHSRPAVPKLTSPKSAGSPAPPSAQPTAAPLAPAEPAPETAEPKTNLETDASPKPMGRRRPKTPKT
jgi:carbon storage regulator